MNPASVVFTGRDLDGAVPDGRADQWPLAVEGTSMDDPDCRVTVTVSQEDLDALRASVADGGEAVYAAGREQVIRAVTLKGGRRDGEACEPAPAVEYVRPLGTVRFARSPDS
jgi:hypothetical protein